MKRGLVKKCVNKLRRRPSQPGAVGRGEGGAQPRAARVGDYFSYGTRLMAYRAVDHYVYERAQHFLRRRHKVSSRGTQRFGYHVVFGEFGVFELRRFRLGPPAHARV